MQLTIEKMIYGGDGMARLPADEKGRGKAAFVPFTLPGEQIDADVREEKAGFVRASLSQVLQPSPQRIQANCPYFQSCGGCHYQHTGYEQQLAIKADILRENLHRLAKLDLDCELKVHASPPWHYRNRTRLQVRADSGFTLGYFKAGSHELLGVETCPISSPLLNSAITALWKLGLARKIPGALREIELFANEDDTRLQVEVYSEPNQESGDSTQPARQFVESLRAELPEVVSAGVFKRILARARGAEGHVSEQPDWTVGPGEFVYRTKAGPLRVSAGSFFQVNRFLVDDLVQTVTAGRSGELALDLYAGVGLFTMALASSFRHIVAVESSQGSANDLQYNSSGNVKVVRSTVDAYLSAKSRKLRPGLVVVDPPRAGLGERVARGLAQLGTAQMIYVSCDPATLARDLRILIQGGYRIQRMHLIDLFPQTFHIESIVELAH